MSGEDSQTIWLPNSVMRERSRVPSVRIEDLQHVRGYLKPRYIDELPDGRRVAELHERDLERVQDGYACGECLAFFDQRFLSCPGCAHLLDANSDIVQHRPAYWEPNEGRTSAEILKGGSGL